MSEVQAASASGLTSSLEKRAFDFVVFSQQLLTAITVKGLDSFLADVETDRAKWAVRMHVF